MLKLKSMMAVSSRQIGHHTIFGNISLFQIHQKLKKSGAKIAACKFCDKTFSDYCTTRVTAHILGVLYKAKIKLEYNHVSQSTKTIMI